ncbi:Cdc42 like protein [Histomonas meleagridis]|uniref:Cdc42 like protein n=1 Tax=Histomonas meleagridis TaxID=135588 RepID=UPI00355A32C3|nr:Cdc42 like protein [Histomonas meleagridis]KAH0799528.1 Cdc42 like protein [Histomonas meleagridis]
MNNKYNEKPHLNHEHKLTFIGSPQVGKSSYLMTYKNGNFPKNGILQVIETYKKDFEIPSKEENWRFIFCDTSSTDEYQRYQCFPYTDVFMICFSVINPQSYQDIFNYWLPTLASYQHDRPKLKLIIGLQTDLRKQYMQSGYPVIAFKDAKEAFKNNGLHYVECTAYKKKNIKKVLKKAADLLRNDEEEEDDDDDDDDDDEDDGDENDDNDNNDDNGDDNGNDNNDNGNDNNDDNGNDKNDSNSSRSKNSSSCCSCCSCNCCKCDGCCKCKCGGGGSCCSSGCCCCCGSDCCCCD